MRKIFFAICMIALIASPVFADDSALSGGKRVITLTDATGGGPGVLAIGVSQNSWVTYSGVATAGGFSTGTPLIGQVMCATAVSFKADPNVALYIAGRSSMTSGTPDDNSIYQFAAAGTTPTEALNTGYATGVDFPNTTGWLMRGGS
ncbi:MAG: hypothetical protein KAQ72_02690 [Desulfobacula sp.]|nr:hypothetical protein [Desulfobacula sp.]